MESNLDLENGVDKAIYRAASADPDWSGVIADLEAKIEELQARCDDYVDEVETMTNKIADLEEANETLREALDEIHDTARKAL